MPDKVVDLNSRRVVPHLEGKARCLACQHEWAATSALKLDGSHAGLDCPSCGTHRGVFKATVSPVRYWVCAACSCDVFMLDGDDPTKGWWPRCISCGLITDPYNVN